MVRPVAGIPVRNQAMVAFVRSSGVSVHTCEPVDPGLPHPLSRFGPG